MKRVVVIDKCWECPFFNHDDQTVEAKWGKSWCEKQDKELDMEKSKTEIPDECPLDPILPMDKVKEDHQLDFCKCGHQRREHAKISSHNYTDGKCLHEGCKCGWFNFNVPDEGSL